MDELTGIRIVPTAEEHVEGFNRCVDIVARERKYLGLLEGPPVEASRAFVRTVTGQGGVHLVAVDPSGQVVGWCDIARHQREGFRHSGELGMGLLPAQRRKGLGGRLLRAALDAARARGVERVELGVFASNTRAIALYERLGFEREGLRRKWRKLDGRYDDDVVMAVLLDADPEMREGQ